MGFEFEMPPKPRCLTVIGANGAGKTLFTHALASSMGEQAFRMSALNALYYNGEPQAERDSTDALYLKASKSPGFLTNSASTPFDRLMALLLNEEIAALVSFKVSQIDDARNYSHLSTFARTKLDDVILRWQELFPSNQVLRQGGRLLFARQGETDTYSQLRLSAGERAVLYYLGAVLYAPINGVIFVDSPEMFLHPSLQQRVWDTVESIRPDCRFVYTTHDLEFTGSRQRNMLLWVKSYNRAEDSWEYTVLPRGGAISDEIYMAIIGSRKPILFIEGDATHSIDAKLYPLVFRNFTVKSLGSCDKVIESTRAFNDQKSLHHLESRGIVDRDRRDKKEVEYLRGKNIFVPEVAEIENILMLEEVIRTVASANGLDENKAFRSVKKNVLAMFAHDIHSQAMQHTRHRIKRMMEYRVDGRFQNIGAFEAHIAGLVTELNPRGMYEQFCRDFNRFLQHDDYAAILRVYNQKSMLTSSGVSTHCGLSGSKDAYIDAILKILRRNDSYSQRIRQAITDTFSLPST